MKVLWVTHDDLFGPPVIGGAEMADQAMASQAPSTVEVVHARPDEPWPDADRVIVSRFEDVVHYHLSERLLGLDVTYWLHGYVPDVFSEVGREVMRPVVEQGRVVCCSTEHLLREKAWLSPKEWLVNPGWMDTSECRVGEKEDFALWAARPDYIKGLDQAIEETNRRGIELRVLMNTPRSAVLEAMSRARYFILLSRIFDVAPRSVIEAQLSGCELIVNENVGLFDEPIEDLRWRIDNAATEFWSFVGGKR